MRRRVRFLRKARELAYRDLGGLVFNLHRFGQRNDALVLAKLSALSEVDAELRGMESALKEHRSVTVLHEAGVSACPRCAAIHSGEDHFCPNCGLPMSRHVDLPIGGAAASPAGAATAGGGAPAPAGAAPAGTAAPSAASDAAPGAAARTTAPPTPVPAPPARPTPAPPAAASTPVQAPATGRTTSPSARPERPFAGPSAEPPPPPAAEPAPPAEDQPTKIIRPPAKNP
jgi:hypothetical protein